MSDNVNHPAHYETGKYECIEVMLETQGVEAVKDFCICNAFKYLWREVDGKSREERFADLCLDLYDSFNRDYVTLEDLAQCLWEEAGIKLERK